METSLPYPPTLSAEIRLLFDHDFPLEQIDSLLELCPKESKRQAQTRINPITQKRNPGFWTFQIDAISSFDSGPLLLKLEKFLLDYFPKLSQATQLYSPCSIMLCIHIVVQQENEYPSLRFSPELLQLFSSLNASVDIVVENNYA